MMMLLNHYGIYSFNERSMDYWYLKDGEKLGPLTEFEIRSRIRNGDVQPDDKVWYRDLDAWLPLREVEALVSELPASEDFLEDFEEINSDNVDDYLERLDQVFEGHSKQAPPPLPIKGINRGTLWRRFAARWFDFQLYILLFLTTLLLANAGLGELMGNKYYFFVLILPWILFEAVALTSWGTTPGKWLTGFKVRDEEGKKLSARTALLRTIRVMILGMGFGIPILREVSWLFHYWLSKKIGSVLWDTSARIRVQSVGQSTQRWVAYGLLLGAILISFMAVNVHVYYHEMTDEQRAPVEDLMRSLGIEPMDAPLKGPRAESPEISD